MKKIAFRSENSKKIFHDWIKLWLKFINSHNPELDRFKNFPFIYDYSSLEKNFQITFDLISQLNHSSTERTILPPKTSIFFKKKNSKKPRSPREERGKIETDRKNVCVRVGGQWQERVVTRSAKRNPIIALEGGGGGRMRVVSVLGLCNAAPVFFLLSSNIQKYDASVSCCWWRVFIISLCGRFFFFSSIIMEREKKFYKAPES